jgi:hypothetical protein
MQELNLNLHFHPTKPNKNWYNVRDGLRKLTANKYYF